MRKLKLQMQVTVDGRVAGPEGQLDWMTLDMDAGLLDFINRLTDTSDTILLGRKMTDGFIKYWEQVVTQKDSPEYDFAQKMVGMPKVVFSRTLKHVEGTPTCRSSGGESTLKDRTLAGRQGGGRTVGTCFCSRLRDAAAGGGGKRSAKVTRRACCPQQLPQPCA